MASVPVTLPIACMCPCHKLVTGPLIMHDEPCCQLYGSQYLDTHSGKIIRPRLLAAIAQKGLFDWEVDEDV